MLPADAGSRFVVASIRNPWDHYVSPRSFGRERNGGTYRRATERDIEAAARRLPKVPPLLDELTKPAPAWRAVYAEPHTPEQFRRWLVRQHDPDRSKDFDPGYGTSQVRHIVGLLTYRYCRMFSDGFETIRSARTSEEALRALDADYLTDAMVRIEHMADDFLEAVRGAGYEVDHLQEKEVRVRAATPVNRPGHLPYTAYFDERSVELVAERDAPTIARRGYQFDA